MQRCRSVLVFHSLRFAWFLIGLLLLLLLLLAPTRTGQPSATAAKQTYGEDTRGEELCVGSDNKTFTFFKSGEMHSAAKVKLGNSSFFI